MSIVTLIVLALVQGLTEFLPVSSSAHLILAPDAAGFEDQGVLIDLMAHVGSLAAVMIYFRNDVAAVVMGKIALLQGRITPGGRLVLLIAAATPPVLLAGAVLYFFRPRRRPALAGPDRMDDDRLRHTAVGGGSFRAQGRDHGNAGLSLRHADRSGAGAGFAARRQPVGRDHDRGARRGHGPRTVRALLHADVDPGDRRLRPDRRHRARPGGPTWAPA